VAVDLGLHCSATLGGVVAISSSLMAESAEEYEKNPSNLAFKQNSTPILLTHGTRDKSVPLEVAKAHVSVFYIFKTFV
jgi:predicted esterase